ncbi:MAG: phage capsid protein, partial [Pseudomonadota bacterium]
MPEEGRNLMPDTARAEVLAAGRAALARLAPDLPPSAATLMERLHAAIPTTELAGIPAEQIAEATAHLFALAQDRQPGQTRLRMLAPGPGRGSRTVALVVTDDMPFLVDSVLAAVTLQSRAVERFLHPILGVRREAGRLVDFDPAAPRESMMHVTLSHAGNGSTEALEAALERSLGDLRRAVNDFPAMLQHLKDASAETAPHGPAGAFLRWLAEDNFVLLGYRELAVGADGALSLAEGQSIGLLRDLSVPVFDALRDLDAVPAAVRAAIVDHAPIAVVKANMRATVHRPQHADVVAVRRFGADGRVVGVRLFLGLFAASAYNRNPRAI